jgi:predicted AAA+ superfamily ATPase
MEYKQIVVNWKEFEIPEVLHRLNDAELNTDFILTITGPRRAGKTYFCFQLMKKLLKEGISRENILYINFEDNKLMGATADDLDKILDSFLELSNLDKKQKTYFFFDEIQTVKDWDAWTRKMHDTRKDIQLILTGSNSKLLSKEISTKLRGRVINKEIFPLSFKEYLAWNKIDYNTKTVSFSKDKIEIKKAFSNFLTNGGYPAVLITKTVPKETIFQSYYDSMIFKDIIERYKIEDIKKLKSLAQLLFQSVSSEISYTKLANKLKSIGFKIGKSTIIEYTSYFEDAYLFFQNMKYEYSLATQMGSIKKLYCIDNGLLNSISFKSSEDTGKLLENLAYIELKRRNKLIYYHRAKYECDFIIVTKNTVSTAIQVTQKLDENNEEREIKGLLEAIKEHKLEEGLILTQDQEEERTVENKKITIMPLWKWLLE